MIPTDAKPVPIQAPLLIPALQELRWAIEALTQANTNYEPDYAPHIKVLVDAMADALKTASRPVVYMNAKFEEMPS